MEGSLKDRLAEALQFPRELIRNEMHLEDCAHGGIVNKRDLVCQECADQHSCKWLLNLEDISDFQRASLNQLVDALGYALESVRVLLQGHEHDPFCHCDACVWHRQADSLYGEARCHPELGPPPRPH